MIVLSCNNISKSFGIDLILENISLSIHQNDRIGLIGANGAGKTSLLKILCQELSYDEGDLYIAKSIKLGYLEQSNVLDSSKTVFEEVVEVFLPLMDMENDLRKLELEIAKLGKNNSPSSLLESTMNQYSILLEKFNKRNGYGFRSEVRGVLKGLGFSDDEFNQPIPQLSGGQKTRISLAKLLLSQPDILILDEPTNHLDIKAVEWLERFLKDYNGAILMVSHDRYFLDQLVNRIVEIENHQLQAYNGNYTDFIGKKEIIKEQELKDYIQQQKEILRQKDMIRRLKQHGTEKLISRAKSKEKQLAKIEELHPPQIGRSPIKIRFHVSSKSGNDVLSIENLAKSFDDTPLFHGVTFNIYKGERVSLIGPNGVGKSTILKIILNKIKASGGGLHLGHNVKLGYYAQEQENLNLNKLVINEIWDDHIYMKETEVRKLLGSFLFRGDDVFKPVSALSGGEKAKLSLLKLILSDANFLLLDEPTNHLDIDSKEILEKALLQYDGTILSVSHDRYFLNHLTTKLIELTPDGTESFLSNYNYYLEKKNENILPKDDRQAKTKTQSREERRKERQERLRIRQLVKDQEKIEEKIILLEERHSELEALMCREEVYSDPERSKEIHQETAIIKDKLDKLYKKWELFGN